MVQNLKLENTTFPQRQTTTSYNQWAQSSRRDEPIMEHDSLRTWHCWETPTWAVLWHGTAKWTNTICVCVVVCVCVPTCQSVSGSELPCQRVCSCMWPCLCVSAGMPPLSKQGSACHMVSCVPCGCHGSILPWGEMQEEGRVQEEVEDCEVGLSGIPQWCQYGKNTMDSTRIFHEPLLFQPLRQPFRTATKIWMNIKAGRWIHGMKN